MFKVFVPRAGGLDGFNYFDGNRLIGRVTIINSNSFAWVSFSVNENDRYGDASSLEEAESNIGFAEPALV